MCGIAGLVRLDGANGQRPSATDIASAMVRTLAYCGPDDEGVWQADDGSVALAQRRLSIIDLSPLGHNPMAWDGGRLWITFNGEIYNFLELRGQLEQLGHRFRSRSDTEVILAAYDEWGVDCVDRLAGMFALALWDSPRRRLWLVRDRLGKKPRDDTSSSGTFRFASELKALVADPGFSRDVDPAAIRMYLRYGYVPSPSTVFAGARKLLPGHHLLFENGRATIRRYWICSRSRRISRHAATFPVGSGPRVSARDGGAPAVDRRRSARRIPVGRDRFLARRGPDVRAVSRPGADLHHPLHEREVRRSGPRGGRARCLGTDHSEATCAGPEMLAVVDRLVDMYDEPFADSSAVPTYLVSRIALDPATVALSGDGGDELFFGTRATATTLRRAPCWPCPA